MTDQSQITQADGFAWTIKWIWVAVAVACLVMWILGWATLRYLHSHRRSRSERVGLAPDRRLVKTTGLIATAGVLLLLVALTASRWEGPFDASETGTLGEWLSGLGAIAAVIAAGLAVLWEVHTRRSDEELAEAVRVFAFAELITAQDQSPQITHHPTTGTTAHQFLVRLRNDSATPAYDPRVEYRAEGASDWDPDVIKFDLGSACVVPQDVATPAVSGAENTPHYAIVDTDGRTIDLRLTYRSATGRHWRITTDGRVESALARSGPWTVIRSSQNEP